MAFNLESISTGNKNRPPRIVFIGVEKIGKSTFAAGSERPVFIPIKGEEGIDDLEVKQFPTSKTLKDVIECLYSLYSTSHDYGTVVIDSASTLEPLIWAETCFRNGNVDSIEKVGKGYGKGYAEATYRWREILEALDNLRSERDMASIIIGHAKVKRFDDPCGDSYDQYQIDVNEKAANILYRWADVILFANTKVIVKKEDVGFNKEKSRGIDVSNGARFLYTQKRPAHPGGGRGVYGKLPYELPLSWNSFIDAISCVKE